MWINGLVYLGICGSIYVSAIEKFLDIIKSQKVANNKLFWCEKQDRIIDKRLISENLY
jgi:hypothetical protein